MKQPAWRKWRKWNNIIHRDLGYLAFGLTVIYAISGIAVNHVHDWNPNYRIETITSNVGAVADSSTAVTQAMVQAVLETLGETGEITGMHAVTPQSLQFFVDERSFVLDVTTGDVVYKKVDRRVGLHEMNFLHLNHPKKLWTYVADLYAVVLLILAVTGLFVIGGKKGIKGRGAWLATAGVLLPLLFLWLYF